MMIKGIKTIIFDLGGVLMDLDKQRCIDRFKDIGFIDIGLFLGEYTQKGIFMDLEEGKISDTQFREGVREHIGKPVTDQQINNAFTSFLVGIPDYKLTMLLRLRQNYKVFMLSNTNPIMFNSRIPELFGIQGLTVSDYFDRLYLSFEMGATKPDPAIFEQIISDSGILPAETLFLDDSQMNIDAAKKFGFETYLAAPHENFTSIFDL